MLLLRVHVYDSPQEALADPAGAALELYYNSAEGIDIAKLPRTPHMFGRGC